MKKILNDPKKAAEESMDGIVLSQSQILRRIPGRRIVVRKSPPVIGKVGLICGGGSGHEPAHSGYVGRGMLDAAVMGDVFTSPAPGDIITAIESVTGGAGVLLIVWNYTGDVMNFTFAEESAREKGVATDHVIVNDDVAIKDTKKRRGVGGTVFVQKIAGAKAEQKASLEEVKRVAESVIRNCKSMGIALSPCIVPAVGKPTFTISEDEVELGIGIHGEPGVQKAKMMKSEEIAAYLVNNIVPELGASQGDEVAVMVQGMGGTSNMEKFIFFRDAYNQIAKHGLNVRSSFIGEYTPSMEMTGIHLTILKLDDELRALLEESTEAPGWHVWS
jgi:dihydroxyacetone kinase-like protein